MKSLLKQAVRVFALALFASVLTILLMRLAPGYFSDERELDPQFSAMQRQALDRQSREDSNVIHLLGSKLLAGLHGDLGRSRHYDVPVRDLLRERAGVTAGLVARSVVCGWAIALLAAIVGSTRRSRAGDVLIAAPAALLLAAPVSALATLCLFTDHGGPLLVLAAVIAARDFKMLYRLMRRAWRAPHIVYAHASGLGTARILRTHLLPMLARELLTLMMSSFVVALSLAVPVEVIFDVPGVGQLAWSAALNRDLTVLLAITLLMAAGVGIAASLSQAPQTVELA